MAVRLRIPLEISLVGLILSGFTLGCGPDSGDSLVQSAAEPGSQKGTANATLTPTERRTFSTDDVSPSFSPIPSLAGSLTPANGPSLTSPVEGAGSWLGAERPIPEGARDRWGNGRINRIDVSPDGKSFALAGSLGVFLYRMVDFELIWGVWTSYQVKNVAFSPNGEILAVSVNDGFVYLLDSATGTERTAINLLDRQKKTTRDWLSSNRVLTADSVSFSPDGSTLAIGYCGEVLLFGVFDGRLIQVFQEEIETMPKVAFSPDGAKIAAGDDRYGTIVIWNAAGGPPLFFLEGHTKGLTGLSWSPDSSTLASSSEDNTVQIWDATTGRRLRYMDFSNQVKSVIFSPDGSRFATGSDDGSIVLWDAVYHNTSHFRASAGEPILNIVFPGAASSLLVASWNRVSLWDVDEKAPIRTLEDFHFPALSAEYLPDTGEIAAWTIFPYQGEGRIVFLDPGSGQVLRTVTIPFGTFVSRKYDQYASLSNEGDILIFDLAGGKQLYVLHGLESEEAWRRIRMVFSPDGKLLAAIVNNYREEKYFVKIWEIGSGKLLNEFPGGPGDEAVFSPDGTMVMIGEYRFGYIYDVRSGQSIPNEIDCHDGGPRGMSFSPDNSMYLYGCYSLKIGDLNTGDIIGSYGRARFGAPLYAVSPDSRRLAVTAWHESSIEPDAIEIWDIQEKKLLFTFRGHNEAVRSLSFSPDGKTLASAGEDGTVILWDLD